ncbi:MAG: hypothetical protein ABI406_20470, partial [Ktedonobacteraceae bacterium]
MTTQQDNNYVLIPHPIKAEVLLLRHGDQWALPQLSATEAGDIHRVIQEQLGLDITVLDTISPLNRLSIEHTTDAVVYATDNHSLQWSLPENASWIGRAELVDIALSVPEHRDLLEGWCDEVEHGNIPEQRVPWARIGWFDEAMAWIAEQVARLGYTIVVPIEQVHVRAWSTVLRVSTSDGLLYFKAVASGFAYEPMLTQFLSTHWPECIPHVLVVDTEHRWMLMKDAGRPLRGLLLAGDTRANSVYLEQAFAQYAQFQIETANYTDALLSLGCPDRRLH